MKCDFGFDNDIRVGGLLCPSKQQSPASFVAKGLGAGVGIQHQSTRDSMLVGLITKYKPISDKGGDWRREAQLSESTVSGSKRFVPGQDQPGRETGGAIVQVGGCAVLQRAGCRIASRQPFRFLHHDVNGLAGGDLIRCNDMSTTDRFV